MEQQRRVIPPVYLLLSLVSMTLLHTYPQDRNLRKPRRFNFADERE